MLCEPAENGWRCSKLEDGRWVPHDVFATVVIENREVTLPPLSGKVLFDDKDCNVVMERGLKILVCKKPKS
jgi:glutamine cyclotransferase